MTDFVQILVSGTTVGSVVALVAFGYTLVYSTSRVVNFAQGSMLVVAGFFATLLVRSGWGILPAFLGTIAFMALVGIAVEVVALRPLGRFDPATNVGWILTTFSAGIIAIDLVKLWIGSETRSLPPIVRSVGGWERSLVAGVAVKASDVLLVVVTIVLAVGLERFLDHTRQGRALRAVSQDRQAASLMGINPTTAIMLSFALAGVLAGVGAVLLAPRLFIKVENGIVLGVQAFVAAVLGGLGSTRGAIVGGYAIGFTTATVNTVWADGQRYQQLVVFALFLAVLVVRPTGLLGRRVVEKV